MACSVSNALVESTIRKLLLAEGYVLSEPLRHGQTGPDIIAKRGIETLALECIGYQDVPPLRSKQFYEAFFRAVSRLDGKIAKCVMVLPARFANGLDQRARQHQDGWRRIGNAFPELEIWLVDTEQEAYIRRHWSYWPRESGPSATPKTSVPVAADNRNFRTIKAAVYDLFRTIGLARVTYEMAWERARLVKPDTKFNKAAFAFWKSRFKAEHKAGKA